MNSNGFLISFDALIALLVLFAMLITATLYFSGSQYSEQNNLILKSTAMDSLAVMEKTGILESAVAKDNSSELRGFLNRLPNSVCSDLRIFSNSDYNNAVISVLREGCEKAENSITIKRS